MEIINVCWLQASSNQAATFIKTGLRRFACADYSQTGQAYSAVKWDRAKPEVCSTCGEAPILMLLVFARYCFVDMFYKRQAAVKSNAKIHWVGIMLKLFSLPRDV